MDPSQDRRDRGRPQLRPDEETRALIFEAARHVFAEAGFAAASMGMVARRAGVSTKTLYRLVPSKAALFEGTVSDRLDRLLFDVQLRVAEHNDIEDALHAVLMTCGGLALDPEVVAMQRMVLQEAGQFSDIAGAFYRNGMQRTAAALSGWLQIQQDRGLVEVESADEAAGMLMGMLVSAPQRAAIFGGEPLPSRKTFDKRARTCAALFLRGCARDAHAGP
ncbi:TetR/AcrR family transcriptional regulator [Tardiphaga sp. P9-11]|uniref:TetR/AcrR family transcriptional regulator n=1 Tax=Tardiphaga sp. P9-11 TaxID=2024614 RepID=UPI0032E35C65